MITPEIRATIIEPARIFTSLCTEWLSPDPWRIDRKSETIIASRLPSSLLYFSFITFSLYIKATSKTRSISLT